MNCIFCNIVAGKLPASIIFENDHILSFMSLDQPNPFKALVIPKQHIETIYNLPEHIASELFVASVRIAKAIRDASHCEGLNIIQSNEKAGQQDVFHFHIHLLPRWQNDNITLDWDVTPHPKEKLNALSKKIAAKL